MGGGGGSGEVGVWGERQTNRRRHTDRHTDTEKEREDNGPRHDTQQ